VTNDAAGKIHVLLQLLKVRPHVVRAPRVITRKAGDVRPVTVMSGDSNQGVVTSASAESTSTRIKNTQRLRIIRWGESNVVAAIGLLVNHL
jgi:hypothetical protein